METIINIKDFYPSTISTRKAISILKDQIILVSGDKYIFDFLGISFISRSFADEFLKYLKRSEVKWSFKNANANIKATLNAVKKSQEGTRSDTNYVSITKFKSNKEINKFLASF
jgi:hypothetical protein